jgi:hypothetical protein
VVTGLTFSVWGTHWDRRNSSTSTAFPARYVHGETEERLDHRHIIINVPQPMGSTEMK